MIIDCMVHVNKTSDLEEQDNMLEKLGLEPPPIDCYWLFDVIDIHDAIRCHPCEPEEDASETCMDAQGCAVIMWNDNASVITNIPFDLFVTWWYKKRDNLNLSFDEKKKELILMP